MTQRLRFIAIAFALLLPNSTFAQSTKAETLVPLLELTEEQAKSRGWVRKRFEIGPPEIRFETFVPGDAKVETARMEPKPVVSGLADIKTVAKVTLGDAPVGVTVTAFDLAHPGAATLVCDWGLEEAGYETTRRTDAPRLTHGQRLGFRRKDGKAEKGAFIACMNNGRILLTFLFTFDPTSDDAVTAVRGFAGAFLGSLVFESSEVPSFAPGQLNEVPIVIGQDRRQLPVPKGWEVRINDFTGSLPAELHLIREEGGKPKGLVWLGVREMAEKPDLDKIVTPLIRDYFAKQSDARPPEPRQAWDEFDVKEAGILQQGYRFAVTDKNGKDAGDIEAFLAWHEGRLHVVTLWSPIAKSVERNAFFTRLPGLTAYAFLKRTLLAHLKGER